MAKIELEPGERFEHTHAGPSVTYLVSGQAEVEIDGVSVALTAVPLSIPAGKRHVMRNTGPIPAVIGCGHAAADEVV